MNLGQMSHIIRAVAECTNCVSLLVIGSQAILGHCLDRGFDFDFCESLEVDIVPIPDNELVSDIIDGTLGEQSPFNITHGYYAHGVSIKTAVFPLGWENRVLEKEFSIDLDKSVRVFFPSVEDLILSKCIAGREKDIRYIEKIAKEGLADTYKLNQYLQHIPKNIGEEKIELVNTIIKRIFI